jgi:hypothetical protein
MNDGIGRVVNVVGKGCGDCAMSIWPRIEIFVSCVLRAGGGVAQYCTTCENVRYCTMSCNSRDRMLGEPLTV